MGLIDYTNIVIDDFNFGKDNPLANYVYILTRVHTDESVGLNNSWDYGDIYCSEITALLILKQFPGLQKCIKYFQLNEAVKIPISSDLEVAITFLDANHYAGSVMVLMEGYFGRFLYTGDFRFCDKVFRNHYLLYPSERRLQKLRSLQIDKLWLDTTFCDERYDFPPQEELLVRIYEVVEASLKQKGMKIYIGIDRYGKEEILTYLALKLDMLIWVDQQRYETIIAMGKNRQLFTTNPEESQIHVVPRRRLRGILQEDKEGVAIQLSGSLVEKSITLQGQSTPRIYYFPYSLHSNYKELEEFLDTIHPGCIQPLALPKMQKSFVYQNNELRQKQSDDAFKKLRNKYETGIFSLSYESLHSDPKIQHMISSKLKSYDLLKIQKMKINQHIKSITPSQVKDRENMAKKTPKPQQVHNAFNKLKEPIKKYKDIPDSDEDCLQIPKGGYSCLEKLHTQRIPDRNKNFPLLNQWKAKMNQDELKKLMNGTKGIRKDFLIRLKNALQRIEKLKVENKNKK